MAAAKAKWGDGTAWRWSSGPTSRAAYPANKNPLYRYLMFEEATGGSWSRSAAPAGSSVEALRPDLRAKHDPCDDVPARAAPLGRDLCGRDRRHRGIQRAAKERASLRRRAGGGGAAAPAVTEIWIDEVGHAAYLRAKIGPMGIRIARRLVPLFTRALLRAVPQGEKIALTPASLLAGLRGGIEMPPEMHWIAQDPSAI